MKIRLISSILFILMGFSNILASDIPEFLLDAKGEVEAILKIKESNSGLARLNTLQAANIPFAQKRESMQRLMVNKASESQRNIVDEINLAGDNIAEYKSFWITNAIYVKGDADYIRNLIENEDVEFAFENLDLVLVEPVFSEDAEDANEGIEPGLAVIGVRDAWRMGLTGKGRLVCNFDTGVDGTHEALQASWRGANGGSVSESWFDPYTSTDFPTDSRGHGTHTMGTMVGVDGADTIGVAYEAQWIAAGVVDRGGSIERTISDIISAFEWAVDPDGNPGTSDDVPDVVNNSWGVPSGLYGPCDDTFWDAIDNLEALGVVCLFAAGNEGPTPSSIRTPADRITTQFNSFAIGAVDGATMNVSSFSSRGPSGCDGITIKPEITAPGSGIRSSINGGGYAYKSGTSMATPHVAGAVAILKQFNPDATVNQIKNALIQGAVDMGAEGQDNDYGYGVLNIKNSIYHMPAPTHPFINILNVNISDSQNGVAEPGESFSLQLSVENLGQTGNVSASVRAIDAGVIIMESNAGLGVIMHRDTIATTIFDMMLPETFSYNENIILEITFSAGNWSQALTVDLLSGGADEMSLATISNGTVTMTFSNYGQFGLGENSINPSGGAGFRYPVDGIDFMKEASLMISSYGRVSDGARDEDGIPDNDFKPVSGGAARITAPGIYADYDGFSSYTDSLAEMPIGVSVSQRCYAWDLNAKFIIAEFTITNTTTEALDDIRVGMFCDWDLALSSGIDDVVNYDDVRSLGYLEDITSGWTIGVRAITDFPSSYRAIDCAEELADGFSNTEKAGFMNDGFDTIHYTNPGDYAQLLTVGPYTLNPGESEVVAFAFVTGESLSEIRVQADLAFDMYPQMTGVDDVSGALPESVKLYQNYPNPFNNTTVIGIDTDSPTQLRIYDILGKTVREFDVESSGHNEIVWDGCNQSGQSVVSGVYFYQLMSNKNLSKKKMLFLK